MGIPNSFLLNEVPAKIAEQFPAYFDKILIDAPCSGEGMFRKNPEAARVWSEEKPPECAKMQRDRKTGDLHAETGRHDDLFDLYLFTGRE